MDQTRLEYFLTVADSRTLSEAAARLHISQPSLSAAIRTFEKDCGFPVFDRINKRLVLNDAGEQLLPHARSVASAMRGAESAAQELRGLTRGEITVACPLAVPDSVCELIADFRQEHPDITITLTALEGSTRVGAAVMESRADVGIVHGPPVEDGRSSIPLAPESLVLLVPPSHRLADRTHVTLADLEGLDVITSQSKSYSSRLLRDAVAAGHHPRPVIHCPHRAAVPMMVKHGAGVAVVATTLHNPDDPTLRGIPFSPERPVPTSLMFRPGTQTPATQAFLRLASQARN